MRRENKCIFCGTETLPYIENGVRGRVCPNCDYHWYLEDDVIVELERKYDELETDYEELEEKYSDVDTSYQDTIAEFGGWEKFLDEVCDTKEEL